MNLATLDQRFKRSTCPIKSECSERPDATHFSRLFESDWEVFVIKHDKISGAYKWFTECCERLTAKLGVEKLRSTAACC